MLLTMETMQHSQERYGYKIREVEKFMSSHLESKAGTLDSLNIEQGRLNNKLKLLEQEMEKRMKSVEL